MEVTFRTDNPDDIAYVRKLLAALDSGEAGEQASVANGGTTPYYLAFLRDVKMWYAKRRPHMLAFAEKAVGSGLEPEPQPPSNRLALYNDTTPVVYLWTSGRVSFRIPPEQAPSLVGKYAQLRKTSPSDTKVGWGVELDLTSDEHLKTALAVLDILIKHHV